MATIRLHFYYLSTFLLFINIKMSLKYKISQSRLNVLQNKHGTTALKLQDCIDITFAASTFDVKTQNAYRSYFQPFSLTWI